MSVYILEDGEKGPAYRPAPEEITNKVPKQYTDDQAVFIVPQALSSKAEQREIPEIAGQFPMHKIYTLGAGDAISFVKDDVMPIKLKDLNPNADIKYNEIKFIGSQSADGDYQLAASRKLDVTTRDPETNKFTTKPWISKAMNACGSEDQNFSKMLENAPLTKSAQKQKDFQSNFAQPADYLGTELEIAKKLMLGKIGEEVFQATGLPAPAQDILKLASKELIDEYVKGGFSKEDKNSFENVFMKIPANLPLIEEALNIAEMAKKTKAPEIPLTPMPTSVEVMISSKTGGMVAVHMTQEKKEALDNGSRDPIVVIPNSMKPAIKNNLPQPEKSPGEFSDTTAYHMPKGSMMVLKDKEGKDFTFSNDNGTLRITSFTKARVLDEHGEACDKLKNTMPVRETDVVAKVKGIELEEEKVKEKSKLLAGVSNAFDQGGEFLKGALRNM